MKPIGVPSHGVHINGFVRDPDNPTDIKIWVRLLVFRGASSMQ